MLRTFLDLSTEHMKPETAHNLDVTPIAEWSVAGGRTGHGYFIYAHDEDDGSIPPDLWAVMCFARERGAEYILFDCDAATVEGLPTFDWEGR
ncbi:DUF5983 family protein [Xanthobacter aminoxidans]|uniref:DUF5983 family protein n=1 Tax=Xanthobacter aminoxidans TaxID=186280 RepID=UPI002022D44D|nr:hypothetical protein [Xanthobacter aminoxidans]MCL8382077.1 hypothetical protein [Xanthobacter aminoxidans]